MCGTFSWFGFFNPLFDVTNRIIFLVIEENETVYQHFAENNIAFMRFVSVEHDVAQSVFGGWIKAGTHDERRGGIWF